ncbi:MAG TPA: hypothetical protein VMT37_09305 [Solirubrobacterales bacterium]|nr:hypothetical protein [Solirubrobacterales bacterium]
MPAIANAASYVVNEDFNFTPEVGCNSGPDEECTLEDAIDLANGDGQESTISFDPALEKIFAEGELPAITQPVTIDGTEAGGEPGVEISGETEGKYARAFQITAEEVTIEGLSLVHFYEPIVVESDLAAICGNYIGVELDGETAEPNEIGIWVAPAADETSIGAECAGGGNVISGNYWTGVLDEGGRTHIANNLIGVSASGAPLPNGESPAASQPAGGLFLRGHDGLIGGPGEGNTIADNVSQVEVSGFQFGGGVIVDNGNTTIRGNSIFANQGRGIYFHEPFSFSPPIPAIGSVSSVEGGSTTVDGSVTGLDPMQEVVVDLYANAACDQYVIGPTETIEAGEGERYLGSTTASSNLAGEATFAAALPVQAEGTVLTATGTIEGELGITTSEFSGCVKTPKPSPKPPNPPPPPAPEPEPEKKPTPENGETVAVAPVAGKVFVKRPGGKKKVLKEGETIPVGSIIDATQGKVTLTSVNAAGEEQTAVFYGGVFLVTQHDGSGLVILELRGPLAGCKKGGAGSSSLARGGRKGRRLWGSGHGKFRTEGNYGSATVRGTIWLTEDRCDGTFFKVKRGVVTIRDFTSNETFALPKGKTYFAQP